MSYNYITNKDSPNYTRAVDALRTYGMGRVIEGITIHHWGDPNQNPQFDSIVNYLCRVGGNTSAHYVASGVGRRVACIVSPGDIAWHSGTAWGNARTIGIELDPQATDEDYDVAAELVADIRSAYGDVPIYWHSYFTNTACPGRWNPDRLDKLSYTKFSHATEWGKGGNKVTPAPVPTPTPEAPVKPLFKVLVGTKQVGAYSEEPNAWRAFVLHNGTKITIDGKDVTSVLRTKYETPSPTADPPSNGGGLPVAEKPDYEELEKRVSILEGLVKAILDWLASFKR